MTIEEKSLKSESKRKSFWENFAFLKAKSKNVGEELQTLIQERDDSGEELSSDEKELITSVLKFKDIDADAVCVPRSEIVAVQRHASFEDVLEEFKRSELSRLPVYGKDLDEIVGFVTLKDMVRHFGCSEGFSLRKTARPCCFVPESLSLDNVLSEMRAMRVQMAIVVDEYGGTAGLVTGKDILEELIGDISDENERENDAKIQPLSGGRYRIDPRLEIEDLTSDQRQLLGAKEHENYDTVAGFVLSLIHRIPEKGERISLPTGHIIVVNAVDGRRIRQLTFVPKDIPKNTRENG